MGVISTAKVITAANKDRTVSIHLAIMNGLRRWSRSIRQAGLYHL
jgi:hypothetical protein